MKPWSFTSLRQHETCGRQYYLQREAKVIVFHETEEVKWGNVVHKGLEEYVVGDTPLEPKLLPYKPFADKIISLPGARFVERPFGFARNLEPVDFWDPAAWCRGKIDVGVVNHDQALVADWKTGKKPKPQYENKDQLKLFAAFIMQSHPYVNKVKTAYIWLATGETTVETYTRDMLPGIWAYFMTKATKLEHSYSSGKWIPKPSGLCRGWCGAGKAHCEFWSAKESTL